MYSQIPGRRPKKRSHYSNSLRAGKFGDITPKMARFSAPMRIYNETTQPPLQWMRLFPWGLSAGVWHWLPTPA